MTNKFIGVRGWPHVAKVKKTEQFYHTKIVVNGVVYRPINRFDSVMDAFFYLQPLLPTKAKVKITAHKELT